jgi:biopolymer transport protein ExbB/TolQ
MLDGARLVARLGRHLPLFGLLFGITALVVLNMLLFHNIYLSLFLGIVFVGFFAGQILAFVQLRAIRKDLESGRQTLQVIEEAGDQPDLRALQRRLRKEVVPGETRDLVLGWLELGLQGRHEGYDALLEEVLERRSIRETRDLSLHATLNRTTLKLGFLGTLIGIILTFPPMKRAVLGLSASDGELKFIRDIAMAIDGDQYAILSTLVATGLSILIEFVTIQFLERLYLGLGAVLSRVNEWNTLTLQAAIVSWREGTQKADEAERNRARLEEAVVGSQLALERHLEALATATRAAQGQLGEVARVQLLMEERIARLAEYERQYRDFLSAKAKTVAPDGARGGN